MKIILLAAGEGSRLRPYTADRPKCLVTLGGDSLLAHQLAVLRKFDATGIYIVTGHCGEQLEPFGDRTFHNPDYASTNMVASLMCAAELFDGGDDLIIAYADIVYEARVLDALVRCTAPISTTVDRLWRRLWDLRNENPLEDAETLKLASSGDITEIGRRPQSLAEIEGQYMGLIKVRADHAQAFARTYLELPPDELHDGRSTATMYMTTLLQLMIDRGRSIRAVLVDGGWLEVDTAEDLELYRSLHAEGRLASLCELPR